MPEQDQPSLEVRGEKFRLNTDFDQLPTFIRLEIAASQDPDAENYQQAMGSLNVLEFLIHDEDWPAFKRLARQRQDPILDDEFGEILRVVMEVVTALPTEQSSGSATSSDATSSSSTDGSSRAPAAISTVSVS